MRLIAKKDEIYVTLHFYLDIDIDVEFCVAEPGSPLLVRAGPSKEKILQRMSEKTGRLPVGPLRE